MTRRLACTVALLIALLSLLTCGCAVEKELTRYEGTFLDVFDTVTQVVIYDVDKESATEKVNAIHTELSEYHRLFDIYNDYEGVNNLKTVNDSAGASPVEVDGRVIDLLLYAKQASELTGGKVNVALGSVLKLWHDYREAGIESPESALLPPMDALVAAALHTDLDSVIIDEQLKTVYLSDSGARLDVGAVAKGYAAQKVVDSMRAQGVTSLLLSVGGNVCAIGGRADGESWKVAVQSPDRQGTLCTVSVDDMTLVTSGTYQRYYTVNGVRYHHIIDPNTLIPATYFDSVSILCRDSALADALSTAVFNMPLPEGLAMVESMDDVEALWVEPDGTQTESSGFSSYVIKEAN